MFRRLPFLWHFPCTVQIGTLFSLTLWPLWCTDDERQTLTPCMLARESYVPYYLVDCCWSLQVLSSRIMHDSALLVPAEGMACGDALLSCTFNVWDYRLCSWGRRHCHYDVGTFMKVIKHIAKHLPWLGPLQTVEFVLRGERIPRTKLFGQILSAQV